MRCLVIAVSALLKSIRILRYDTEVENGDTANARRRHARISSPAAVCPVSHSPDQRNDLRDSARGTGLGRYDQSRCLFPEGRPAALARLAARVDHFGANHTTCAIRVDFR